MHNSSTALVPRIIQQIIVIESLMHQFLWKLETVWTLPDNKVSILQDHLEMYFNWKRPPGSS